MSLLSRLGRVLKAEMGRRLPHVNTPYVDTPYEAPYGDASEDADRAGNASANTQSNSGSGASSQPDARIAGYYLALELPFGADITAVKQAHRRLMKRYHPDRFHSEPDKAETANELTRRLNEAYDGLRQYLEANT